MESLEQLQRDYVRSLEEKRTQLRRAWDILCGEDVQDIHVRDMHRRLHQLCGSAGAYGFDTIGNTARQLEKRWGAWIETAPANRVPTYLVCAEIAVTMTSLLDDLAAASRGV